MREGHSHEVPLELQGSLWVQAEATTLSGSFPPPPAFLAPLERMSSVFAHRSLSLCFQGARPALDPCQEQPHPRGCPSGDDAFPFEGLSLPSCQIRRKAGLAPGSLQTQTLASNTPQLSPHLLRVPPLPCNPHISLGSPFDDQKVRNTVQKKGEPASPQDSHIHQQVAF